MCQPKLGRHRPFDAPPARWVPMRRVHRRSTSRDRRSARRPARRRAIGRRDKNTPPTAARGTLATANGASRVQTAARGRAGSAVIPAPPSLRGRARRRRFARSPGRVARSVRSCGPATGRVRAVRRRREPGTGGRGARWRSTAWRSASERGRRWNGVTKRIEARKISDGFVSHRCGVMCPVEP